MDVAYAGSAFGGPWSVSMSHTTWLAPFEYRSAQVAAVCTWLAAGIAGCAVPVSCRGERFRAAGWASTGSTTSAPQDMLLVGFGVERAPTATALREGAVVVDVKHPVVEFVNLSS